MVVSARTLKWSALRIDTGATSAALASASLSAALAATRTPTLASAYLPVLSNVVLARDWTGSDVSVFLSVQVLVQLVLNQINTSITILAVANAVHLMDAIAPSNGVMIPADANVLTGKHAVILKLYGMMPHASANAQGGWDAIAFNSGMKILVSVNVEAI